MISNRNSELAAPGRHRPSAAAAAGVLALLLLALLAAACGPSLLSTTPEPPTGGGTSEPGPQGGAAGALPDVSNKPKPSEITFQGCPPDGDGGDPVLNQLKNRVDNGSYAPVLFDAVEKLQWPVDIERKRHSTWSASDTAQIARYEGLALSIEGYLEGAKEEGPETPNCHGADLAQHDFHIWLTKLAGEDRTRSIVVEMTPRVRAKHASWRVDVLNGVASARTRVRVSGWLMMDPEHPEQLNQTRGTLWEIHPIMQVEVQQQGRWVALDDFAR